MEIAEFAQQQGVRPSERQFKVPRKKLQRWFAESKERQFDEVTVTHGRVVKITRKDKEGSTEEY